MEVLSAILNVTLDTVSDVMPIAAIIFGFQFIVLRQKPANLKQILMGFVWVLAGLSVDADLHARLAGGRPDSTDQCPGLCHRRNSLGYR